eukprot:Hpha_TRINITY_DN15282_c4_g18::TRINITY_DN15282_c4_g18_i1::g.66737::m.66737/K03115/CSNK2B; casein kinase II subunit beta
MADIRKRQGLMARGRSPRRSRQGPEEDRGGDLFEETSEEEGDDDVPWIQWFCGLKGNEFFLEVDEEYIQDDFNLTGLTTMVPFYEYALDVILDLETPGEDDLTTEQLQIVENSAETLYGLIHARFLLTNRGMALAQEKYHDVAWGRCPRVLCGGQAVLPVGQSDVMREASVKVYCPQCQDIYYPRSSRHKSLDGAFWGTTFPHLFIMCNSHIFSNVPRAQRTYVPRIYGFKVRKEQPQGHQHQAQQQQQQQAAAHGASSQMQIAAAPGERPQENK